MPGWPLPLRFTTFPIILRADNLTSLSAVVVAHDAIFRHVVDHAGSSAVTDPEGSLQERYAASTFTNDHFNRLVVQIVMMASPAFT
jgi:hypothetical protein